MLQRVPLKLKLLAASWLGPHSSWNKLIAVIDRYPFCRQCRFPDWDAPQQKIPTVTLHAINNKSIFEVSSSDSDLIIYFLRKREVVDGSNLAGSCFGDVW